MSLKDKALLTDEEIKTAKDEAERLSWTHKAHPCFEEEKYLLETQYNKTIKTLLQSLSDIKPLGEDEINKLWHRWASSNSKQVKDFINSIAQAALEDYNRQVREMLKE